jgi:RNA-binding protein
MKEKVKTLHIGKNGVTENLLDEIKNQLKKHRILNVRILRSAREDKKSRIIAQEVSHEVKAKLVGVRGNTFVLEKR